MSTDHADPPLPVQDARAGAPGPARPAGRAWFGVTAAAVAVAALSLLLMRTPDFDPTAWLIWGRQLSEGTLSTPGGPSWKPFPVLFTTLFAPAGDDAAPLLWLVVARVGGLLAIVLAYRVAARLGGRTSGLLAAAALALATDFLFNAARGDAEGLLVAFALLAIDLHLDGKPRAALLAGAAAGLVRPEVWPALAAYGLLLLRRDRRASTLLLLGGCGVALLAAWFVPERIGSGDWLRAATRAQQPAPGSPGQSAVPFLAVFLNSAIALTWPVYAGAVTAVLAARRAPRGPRERALLGIAAAATGHMVLVAVMAEGGFTGNLRYVTLPAALLCVLGGVGLPPLAEAARRRLGGRRVVGAALTAAAAIAVLASVALLVRNGADLAEEGRVYGRELPELIERMGGERAVLACGPVGGSHFARQMVAYRLHLRQDQVLLGTNPRARTVFARAGTGAAEEGAPPVRARLGGWVLRTRCDVAPAR